MLSHRKAEKKRSLPSRSSSSTTVQASTPASKSSDVSLQDSHCNSSLLVPPPLNKTSPFSDLQNPSPNSTDGDLPYPGRAYKRAKTQESEGDVSSSCLKTSSSQTDSSQSPKQLCRRFLKQFWTSREAPTEQVTECYMRICNASIQFVDFLKFYGSLCNSARCGIVAAKKPMSYVRSRFSNDQGQPIDIEHVSGRGVSGFTVLEEKKQLCPPLGELRIMTAKLMNPRAIEDFIADSGTPCENVSICNEWRFQYKNSVVYRLLQIAEGSGKLEACQKVPDYFVDIFLMKNSSSNGVASGPTPVHSPPLPVQHGGEEVDLEDVSFERFLDSFIMKCSDLVR